MQEFNSLFYIQWIHSFHDGDDYDDCKYIYYHDNQPTSLNWTTCTFCLNLQQWMPDNN